MNSNQLAPISSSFYIKNHGSSFIEKLRGLDYYKHLISDETKTFFIETVNRKVSGNLKHKILDAFRKNEIKIVAFKKEQGINSYVGLIPMAGSGGFDYFMNIGNFAKFDGDKVVDIDPRVLYSLMANAFYQYDIIKNQSQRLANVKFQRIIIQTYKKIMNSVMSNVVRLNIITNEEKLAYDLILSIYICKVLLRKDSNSALTLTKTLINDKLFNKDKVETQLNAIDVNKIESFEDFINELKRLCPSFVKISPALIMQEYIRALKPDALLSIDLIQVLCGVLMTVQVGSSNIFKDQYILKILTDKELDQLQQVLG